MSPGRSELETAVARAPHGAWLDVHVVPRSKKLALAGVRSGALVVRLEAPPVEGAANDALLRHLASALGVPRRRVALVRGLKSRRKRVFVDGVTPDDVVARLSRSDVSESGRSRPGSVERPPVDVK